MNRGSSIPLILLAHGSRDAAWNDHLRQMTQVLRQTCVMDIELAFLDSAKPTLMEVVGIFARQGTRHAKLLPLFLANAGHVTRDVTRLARAAEAAHPGLMIEILPALGAHPAFLDALRRIASAAGS